MDKNFPDVSERVKAAITDSIVIGLFMLGVVSLFSNFNTVPDFVRISAFIFIFILYDPIFTSLFGGTIGHMLIGIRVKRESDEKRNILFPLAIVRFIVKAFLGIISLLTVYSSEKKKAIHDILVGSIVLYSDNDSKE